MSVDWTLLDHDFALNVQALLAACEKRGRPMRAYCGLRTPEQQAVEYRKGRTLHEIEARIGALRSGGAPHLAAVLAAVGPQNGKRVTNAWPGAGWHQYGLAVDCFPVGKDGGAAWDDDAAWACYGAEADHLGLTWGRAWGDRPHVQGCDYEPTRWTLAKIDEIMCERFPQIRGLA